MRIKTILLLALALALALPHAAASAAPTVVQDPNDTPGKLDIMGLGGEKTGPRRKLVVQVRTFASWQADLLDESGKNRIILLFNIDKDRDAEYVGTISFTADGVLQMVLTGKDAPTKPLVVERPSDSAVQVTLSRNSPANPEGDVKVAAKSVLKGRGKCSDTCRDRVPDKGWLKIRAS